MTFDSGRGVTVLFGGNVHCAGGTPRVDTWEWNGTDWTQRFSQNGLNPPHSGGSAYDAARSRVVLFVWDPAQTWEWDGQNWTQRILVGPGPSNGVTLVYDPTRARVLATESIVVAGIHHQVKLWKLETDSWTLLNTTNFPLPPTGSGLAFVDAIGKLVMYRGEINSVSETYVLDDNAWVPLAIPQPPNRVCYGTIYDSARRRVVMFGGHDESGLRGDTWELIAPAPGIVSGPTNTTVPVSGVAHLGVSVGAMAGLSFQWQHNGVDVPADARITGANSTMLTINPVHMADAGGYSVLVTGPCGASTSVTASLTVTCAADFNGTGGVTVADIFAFLLSAA